MQTVGAFEAKTHFSALLKKVEQGEQVIITKNGHAVAKLIPAMEPNRELINQTIQKLKSFNKDQKLDADWKALRDEGRR